MLLSFLVQFLDFIWVHLFNLFPPVDMGLGAVSNFQAGPHVALAVAHDGPTASASYLTTFFVYLSALNNFLPLPAMLAVIVLQVAITVQLVFIRGAVLVTNLTRGSGAQL